MAAVAVPILIAAFDLAGVDGGAALAAFGQAFLSIGVGGAVLMTYGAYVPLGALLVAIFVAWRVAPATSEDELAMAPDLHPFSTLSPSFGRMRGLRGPSTLLLVDRGQPRIRGGERNHQPPSRRQPCVPTSRPSCSSP